MIATNCRHFLNETETRTHRRDQSMWSRWWALGGGGRRNRPRKRPYKQWSVKNVTNRYDPICSRYRRGSSDFPRLFGNEWSACQNGVYGNTTVRKSTSRKLFGSDNRLNILCRNAVRLWRLRISVRSWKKRANDELVDFNYSEDRKISHQPM